MLRQITADEVNRYREDHECGLAEAHRALSKHAMQEALESAANLDDLRPILKWLIDRQ